MLFEQKQIILRDRVVLCFFLALEGSSVACLGLV